MSYRYQERPHFDRERRDLRCPEPECGALMALRVGPRGPFYGCTRYPECKATHRAWADGTPDGTPAPQVTKDARSRLHKRIEELVDARGKRRASRTRDRIRGWLGQELGLRPDDFRLCYLTREQCERAIDLLSTVPAKRTGTS